MKTWCVRYTLEDDENLRLHQEVFDVMDASFAWRPKEEACFVEATLRGGADQNAIREKIEEAFKNFGGQLPDSLEICELAPKDWVTETQKTFKPIDVPPFYIYGSHLEPRDDPEVFSIKLDAAMAFGSGEHATTKGCLMAISDLKDKVKIGGDYLDMGCGSGILAMGLYCLFNGDVLAIDNDPFAVDVARDNCTQNNLKVETVCGDGFKVVPKGFFFDVIAANILLNPLMEMASSLAASLKKGGHAILSGFYEAQSPILIKELEKYGLLVCSSIVLDEWQALTVQKPTD